VYSIFIEFMLPLVGRLVSVGHEEGDKQLRAAQRKGSA
jgi:hypothetical protein